VNGPPPEDPTRPSEPMGPPTPAPPLTPIGPVRHPLIELLPPSHGLPFSPVLDLPPAPPEHRPRYGLATLLFFLTFLCATTLGPALLLWSRTDVTTDLVPFLSVGMIRRVWTDRELLRLGLSYSVPAMLILLCHELGHYIACRRYGLPVTLPYFLPMPMMLGTLGAFIKIKSPLRSKRELFDVGVAGPLAGFAALLPFLLYGVAHSEVVALHEVSGTILVPGHCLALELATWAFHGQWLGQGMTLNLHPFALAAWFGLLATAINLIPLGQLDGGHILYAAAGRWQRRLALPLWVALALAAMLWPGWLLWCGLTLVMGLYHPPVRDERTPLDRKRRWLTVVALAILILSFPLGSALDIVGDVEEQQPGARPGETSAPGTVLAGVMKPPASPAPSGRSF
jgi:hypothetical protein